MSKQVIYVEWEDSSSNGTTGWHSAADWQKHKVIICQSVGCVVFENKHQIVIVGHWHGDDFEEVQGAMRIPKSAIRRRVRLLTTAKKVNHGRRK